MKVFSHIFSIAIILIMIVCCIMIPVLDMPFIGSDRDELLSYSDGWTYADGTAADLGKLRNERSFELIHKVEQGNEDVSLCLLSKNINFTVYLDDERIYDFHPEVLALFGYSYGRYAHSIKLPYRSGSEELRIIAEPSYADGTECFKEIYLDRSGQYYVWLINRYFISFMICVLVAFIGLCLFIVGLVYTVKQENRLQTMSLGLLAVLSGIWESTETPILQIMTQNSAACHFANYLCLMFLPIPAVYLIASLTGFPRKGGIRIVESLVALNFSIQLICNFAGVGDYHVLLTASHVMIVTAVLICIYMIVRSVKSGKAGRKKFFTVVIAFSALAISGIIDILLYYKGNTYGMIFMFGILIFVLYLGYYEVLELLEITEQSTHAKEYHKLAYTDGLTGLENRLSFGEYEQAISKETNADYLIVQFDVNGLKTVNDKYGHSEGDKHILAAADTIERSFGSIGRVFRTGGDEFIAIIPESKRNEYERALEVFGDRIATYNRDSKPPFELSIAHGMAEYKAGDKLINAEVLADNLMYENKKELKSRLSL